MSVRGRTESGPEDNCPKVQDDGGGRAAGPAEQDGISYHSQRSFGAQGTVGDMAPLGPSTVSDSQLCQENVPSSRKPSQLPD